MSFEELGAVMVVVLVEKGRRRYLNIGLSLVLVWKH